MRSRILVAVLLVNSSASAVADPPPEKYRLIVLTDISSLTSGEAEPDDGQSLIRLEFYTNEFDIEGLVASLNMGHGQKVRPRVDPAGRGRLREGTPEVAPS